MTRLVLLLVLFGACGRVDVDVADPPSDACTTNEDCHDGGDVGFCDHGCDNTTGRCKPAACDDHETQSGAVCGCDGTLYANDCLRIQAKVGFAPPYACP